MRNLSITIATATPSSAIGTPQRHNLFRFSNPPPTYSLYVSKQSTPPSPQSSQSPTPTKSSILLSTLLSDPSSDKETGENLPAYAHIASKLVEDGRFEDFSTIVESLLNRGLISPSEFGQLLNWKLVSAGVVRGLREGRARSVVEELLGGLVKLGVDALSLFEGSTMEMLTRECNKILREGNVEEAVNILEILAGCKFPVRKMVKPNHMIQMCTSKCKPHAAVRYACLLPEAYMFVCAVIKEFGKRKDLASALTAFEASEKKLGGHNMYAYRAVIDVCGLCGNCFKSRSIYEDLLARKITPNIYVFNSLMNVNAHDLNYTMHVYKQMQNLGVIADMASYNILLKACSLAGRVDLAQGIYWEVKQLESTGVLKLDLFTYSTIIKVFADAKLWKMALKIKQDMLSAGVAPNTVTWSSLISACANAGLIDQATQLFTEMILAGSEPNTQCFNTLLHACVEACQFDRAFRLFGTWRHFGSQTSSTEGSNDALSGVLGNGHTTDFVTSPHYLNFARRIPFKPTTTTYNILMKACGTDYYRAKALLNEMVVLCISPNHITWSILIDLCGKAGDREFALQILRSMHESGNKPDVVAYTTAIKVCVETKNLKIAFSLFAEMKRYHIQPNLVTYNTLLRARNIYGSLRDVQQCLALYGDMRKAGYKSNDHYLKRLIEEWCEGVIQNNSQKAIRSNSHEGAYVLGPGSLLLERVALHLRQGASEGLVIDVQGLSKVEARIVVLAVLRMIKENHSSGYQIKDDLIIILGAGTVHGKLNVNDTITNLLRNELGLEVASRPSIVLDDKIYSPSPPYSDLSSKDTLGTNKVSTAYEIQTRRPVVLHKIIVTRESLCHWLQRRLHSAG